MGRRRQRWGKGEEVEKKGGGGRGDREDKRREEEEGNEQGNADMKDNEGETEPLAQTHVTGSTFL